MQLLGRLIALTQKTRSLTDCFLVDLGAGRYHAGRIKLRRERYTSPLEVSDLDLTQFFKSTLHVRPHAELLFKKRERLLFYRFMIPTSIQLLAGADLKGAQTVFIEIVLVLFFNAERSIGIAVPTTAQIKHIIDAANPEPT